MSSQSHQVFSFPKKLRLRKKREFVSVCRQGAKSVGKFLVLHQLSKEGQKLGLTVSRRYGRAHERNRIKRQCREAFRLNIHQIPKQLHLNITPRQRAKRATMQELANEILYYTHRE